VLCTRLVLCYGPVSRAKRLHPDTQLQSD